MAIVFLCSVELLDKTGSKGGKGLVDGLQDVVLARGGYSGCS